MASLPHACSHLNRFLRRSISLLHGRMQLIKSISVPHGHNPACKSISSFACLSGESRIELCSSFACRQSKSRRLIGHLAVITFRFWSWSSKGRDESVIQDSTVATCQHRDRCHPHLVHCSLSDKIYITTPKKYGKD